MNFQEFCDQQADSDKQAVTTNDTFVISFSRLGGNAFDIDPEAIVEFLHFMSKEHQQCIDAIQDAEGFDSKKSYLEYQEGPYRALYRLAGENGHQTIKSYGGSQTLGLTQVIAKLIAYLSQQNYSGVKTSSFFDNGSIDIALKKVPQDLRELGGGAVAGSQG